jgi:DNA repair protein RecN (Recombination protein N)
MLKNLSIQNLILIEQMDISFEEGLNVLSGETGSGKSAIIEALSLVLGERADTTVIRKGCEKGSVEAIIDISKVPAAQHLLSESGVDCENGEIIIRREISANGKNRTFINHQSAQLHLLKQLGELVVEFVGQHANRQLLSVENHRKMLDNFGELTPLIKLFSEEWHYENQIQARLKHLIDGESKRLRDIEIYKMELEEIVKCNTKEGEEEELFIEYSRLNSGEEIAQHLEQLTQAFSGERNSILGTLNRCKQNLETLTRLDSSLEDTLKSFQESQILLQDVAYTLTRYSGKVEINPKRAAQVNDRLTMLNRLKKKYGATLAEVEAYRKKLEHDLTQLENADEEITNLQEEIKVASKNTQGAAEKLSQARKKVAKELNQKIVAELRALNMPKVEFKIEVIAQKRSSTGDDKVEFFIAPNVGEHFIPVKDSASVGELSRLMLGLQKLLAGKEAISTLVFDEIDANIGGETASVIGDKLAEIGLHHQVLCITHFPQVAMKAKHHLQISKQEVNGRTFTVVKVLGAKERKQELSRMIGVK